MEILEQLLKLQLENFWLKFFVDTVYLYHSTSTVHTQSQQTPLSLTSVSLQAARLGRKIPASFCARVVTRCLSLPSYLLFVYVISVSTPVNSSQ